MRYEVLENKRVAIFQTMEDGSEIQFMDQPFNPATNGDWESESQASSWAEGVIESMLNPRVPSATESLPTPIAESLIAEGWTPPATYSLAK